jgi:Rieske Fe-S protein
MNKGPNTSDLGRRGFVKIVTAFLGSIMAAVIGLPGIAYLISPATRAQKAEAWIPLGPLANYPVGKPATFNFTRSTVNGWEKSVLSYGVFILRKDENQVKVLSNICTHLGCRVSWHPDIQEYVSPCHDGHFDIDGNVTKGPPPRPLDQYKTKVENGNLFIHLVIS